MLLAIIRYNSFLTALSLTNHSARWTPTDNWSEGSENPSHPSHFLLATPKHSPGGREIENDSLRLGCFQHGVEFIHCFNVVHHFDICCCVLYLFAAVFLCAQRCGHSGVVKMPRIAGNLWASSTVRYSGRVWLQEPLPVIFVEGVRLVRTAS